MNKVSAYEVAKRFKVTPPTVYEWIKKGLPYTTKKVGLKESKYFDLEEVRQWVDNNRR